MTELVTLALALAVLVGTVLILWRGVPDFGENGSWHWQGNYSDIQIMLWDAGSMACNRLIDFMNLFPWLFHIFKPFIYVSSTVPPPSPLPPSPPPRVRRRRVAGDDATCVSQSAHAGQQQVCPAHLRHPEQTTKQRVAKRTRGLKLRAWQVGFLLAGFRARADLSAMKFDKVPALPPASPSCRPMLATRAWTALSAPLLGGAIKQKRHLQVVNFSLNYIVPVEIGGDGKPVDLSSGARMGRAEHAIASTAGTPSCQLPHPRVDCRAANCAAAGSPRARRRFAG